MKRIIYLFVFLVAGQLNSAATSDPETKIEVIPLYKLTNHKAYQPGEELNFSLSYGFITGGSASLCVSSANVNGKQVHRLIGTGRTTGFTDVLYKIRDTYESYVNPVDDLPVKAIRNINEGKYRYYNEVTFNRNNSTVNSQKSGVHSVQEGILDILSAIYFARNNNMNNSMKVGDVIEFMTYFTDKPYPLRIKYRGSETIKTEFGKVDCYVFSPVTEVGRVFETEDDVKVWFTKDLNRIPILIKFNLTVGSFTCELDSYKGLKHPFSSKVK